jgi:hypothetical protein
MAKTIKPQKVFIHISLDVAFLISHFKSYKHIANKSLPVIEMEINFYMEIQEGVGP